MLTGHDYLEKVLTARVYDVAVETPLEPARLLSQRLNNLLLLKREDMQSVFSFKLRGAYNKIVNLPPKVLERGVIAASAGNHAQGVALAAKTLGCKAIIVMPVTTPQIKIDAVRKLRAEVILQGDSYDGAYLHASQLTTQLDMAFIHPYDDPDVIAGQGTVGMEILRQHSKPIHAIFVPVGGGGLISGIAAYVKRLRPETKIIGVEPVEADALFQSLKKGERVRLSQVGLFADGVAVKSVGEETFRICRELVYDVILVDSDAICAAIASGANINFDRLRHVSERAELGEEREAILDKLHVRHLAAGHAPLAEHELLFRFEFPERPGALMQFLNSMSHSWNISLFHYRNPGADYGRVLVGIQVPPQDLPEFQQFLDRLGYAYTEESDNPAYRYFLG